MAAALRASSSRRRSQAFLRGVLPVRRAAVPAGGARGAVEEQPLVDPNAKSCSTSPRAQPQENQRGEGVAAPAQPEEGELGPVAGTKRLCKRRAVGAAAVQMASMPVLLADSTQQEELVQQRAASPLPAWLGGEGPVAPQAESPLPAWLGVNDAPAPASEQPAKTSVSPLWVIDSEEALPVKAHGLEARQLGAGTGWLGRFVSDCNLADLPSLVGGASDQAPAGPVTAGAAATRPQAVAPSRNGHAGGKADGVAGGWRSRWARVQSGQPSSAAAKNSNDSTNKRTYHDTYRWAILCASCAAW